MGRDLKWCVLADYQVHGVLKYYDLPQPFDGVVTGPFPNSDEPEPDDCPIEDQSSDGRNSMRLDCVYFNDAIDNVIGDGRVFFYHQLRDLVIDHASRANDITTWGVVHVLAGILSEMDPDEREDKRAVYIDYC